MTKDARELAITITTLFVILATVCWLDRVATLHLAGDLVQMQRDVNTLAERVRAIEQRGATRAQPPPEPLTPGQPAKRQGSYTGKLP